MKPIKCWTWSSKSNLTDFVENSPRSTGFYVDRNLAEKTSKRYSPTFFRENYKVRRPICAKHPAEFSLHLEIRRQKLLPKFLWEFEICSNFWNMFWASRTNVHERKILNEAVQWFVDNRTLVFRWDMCAKISITFSNLCEHFARICFCSLKNLLNLWTWSNSPCRWLGLSLETFLVM